MGYAPAKDPAGWERQQELEDISGYWGSSRFKRRADRAEKEMDATRIGAARKLLTEAVSRMEKALGLYMDDQTSGRGRRHTAVKWIDKLGVETTSYLTAKVVLGSIGQEVPVRTLAKSIWTYMQDELRCRRFKELAPGLFEYRMANFQTNSRAHMARSISATMSKALCRDCLEAEEEECSHLDPEHFNIPQNHVLLTGTLLIRLFQEAFPGWLEKETKQESHRQREAYLKPTPKAREWMESRNELLQELVPVALPMVVPPRPWGPDQPGGYRYGLLDKFPFIRATGKQKARVREADTPLVYEAVNRLQETPWRINWAVWDTMRKIENGGGGLAGFPEFEPLPMPQRPPELDEDEFDPSILREYKDRVSATHDAEVRRQAEVRKWINLRTVVELVEEEGAIWFPHNLDFRGRVYPIPPFLSPQGDDRSKSLLEFADGKPLGEDGAWWLSIHGANVLGETPGGRKLSRMTLGERSEWIQEQSLRIRDTAREPFSDLWWVDADEPWQFLAFCYAWAGMLEEDVYEEYVCHLPVHLDGTCNGLQHFAGILRDRKTARAVNVIPSERPNDVYQLVTDELLDRLVEEAADGEDYAQRWLASGTVDRKLSKRPTMTFPYGSRAYGFAEQIVEHLRGLDDWPKLEREHFRAVSENGEPYPVYKQAASYLAGLLEEALENNVEAAFDVMEWLQDSARKISRDGNTVEWTVPETNLPVIQDRRQYFKMNLKRVNTHLAGGVSYRPAYYRANKDRPDGEKQSNAVSPNFVHSLDAAALMKTIAMASHDGVEHFAMVHDSYGTHPSHMGILLEATKQSFFHLYSRHDVVQDLYQEFCNQVDDPAILGTPPSLGDLDVSRVLASDYFFA